MKLQRNLPARATRTAGFSSLTAVLALVTVLLLFGNAGAADPPTQPFDLIYEAKDQKYSTAVEGIGMTDETSGTVTISAGDSRIDAAYLVWAGLGTDPDGVTFRRGNAAPVVILPTNDRTWNRTFNNSTGQDTWGCCGGELSVYAADITSLGIVTTGTNSYTLSDMEFNEANWGYSLIVVYEDLSLPPTLTRDIVIKLGNDGLFFDWGDRTDPSLLGPNSDVQCVAVQPANVDREARFGLVIGGIKDDFRPNGIWGLTGSEPWVNAADKGGTWIRDVGLINLPANPPDSPAFDGIGVEIDGPLDGDKTGNGIDWPFSDNAGQQWDEYPFPPLTLLKGREWVCIQVESANRPELQPSGTFQLGASIGFLGFVASIDNITETITPSLAVEAQASYEWTYVVTNPDLADPDQAVLENIRLVAGPYVQVACPKTTLIVGEPMTCTASSSDLGYYGSAAWVIGVPVGGGTAVYDIVFPEP